jgi:hypothetical protein
VSEVNDLEATAYHEAGHVIARWHFGYPIDRVTIVPAGDYTGAVEGTSPIEGLELDLDASEGTQQHTRQAVMVLLAGAEAQVRYSPESFHEYHASADYSLAIDLLLYLGGTGERATAIGDTLTAQTKVLLAQHWPLVETLAKKLLESKVMPGSDVLALLNSAKI